MEREQTKLKIRLVTTLIIQQTDLIMFPKVSLLLINSSACNREHSQTVHALIQQVLVNSIL